MFHLNLKRRREAKGLTQAALAEVLGVSLRNLQNWEQGHRVPKMEMLLPLARVLGVNVESLLDKTETLPPKEPSRLRGHPRKPDAAQGEPPPKKPRKRKTED
ncbi:MAG: helix-turn-helix domain-containing protein [Gemmataceae bacterium]